MSNNNSSKNLILLIVLAVIWGSSYILMKKGLNSFSALQVSMLRIIFAFLALAPFLPKAFKSFQKRDFLYATFVAVLGSGIPSYLYPLAITHVDSGVTGIINTLTPVFTMFFGIMFFHTARDWRKILGVAIALIGAAFLVFFSNEGGTFEFNKYGLAAILATVCYGFSSNILKSKLNHVNPIQLTALTFALIGPVAAIILFSTDFMAVSQANPESIKSLLAIAVLGVFGTAFALVLFNKLIKQTDALYASSVTFLIPIVAIFWGVIDGEQIGVLHLVGLVCILLGIYFMNQRKADSEISR